MQEDRGWPERGGVRAHLSPSLRFTPRPGVCSRRLPLRQVHFHPSLPLIVRQMFRVVVFVSEVAALHVWIIQYLTNTFPLLLVVKLRHQKCSAKKKSIKILSWFWGQFHENLSLVFIIGIISIIPKHGEKVPLFDLYSQCKFCVYGSFCHCY